MDMGMGRYMGYIGMYKVAYGTRGARLDPARGKEKFSFQRCFPDIRAEFSCGYQPAKASNEQL